MHEAEGQVSDVGVKDRFKSARDERPDVRYRVSEVSIELRA